MTTCRSWTPAAYAWSIRAGFQRFERRCHLTRPSMGWAEVFGLLGEPGRLRLLTALLEAGELCVCDLAAATGLKESAVSHALRLLRAHRVVSVSRRGRMAYYRHDDAHVRMLLDLGLTHTQHTSTIVPVDITLSETDANRSANCSATRKSQRH
jgi:DNA-binding transcriptional ArsR family regulator